MFWTFRLATYFVLACATYIFLDIAIKGSRTVFTNHAPFINVKFLTEPPQTLYVFDYQGKKMELSDREFRNGRKRTRNPLMPPASRIRPAEFGLVLLARHSSSSARWSWP
jgi:phosphate transport system permease protein